VLSKFGLFIISVFTFILISCNGSHDKDLSLSVDEYEEMGLPDPAKAWDLNDYSEACAVLSNIKSLKPYSLPKKESRKSGVIFDRIINPENLQFLQDDQFSLNEKAYRIQHYIQVQGCFVTAYTDLNEKEQYYNRELIDLYIFGLTIAQDMLDLGNLINESIEEKDIEIQYGYESIRNMYITMVLYVLKNQQKSHFFKEDDLIRLSDFMYDALFINREWMEDAAVETIKNEVQSVIVNTSSETIRKKYSRLMEIL
jgi:hypothetical protein